MNKILKRTKWCYGLLGLLLLGSMAFGQNYVGNLSGVYGNQYNPATTVGAGGQVVVGTTGNWILGGVVSNRNGGTFTFSGTGTYNSGSAASATGYVDGTVQRTATATDFILPTGSAAATTGGVFHPLSVTSASAALTDTVNYRAFTATPNSTSLSAGVSKVDPLAYWGFTSTAGTGTVTLATRDETGVLTGNIFVAGFNISTNLWEKVGAATPIVTGGQNLVSNAGIALNNYSAFTVGAVPSIVIVNAKVYLQGATLNTSGSLMRTDMNDGVALSMATSQPYNTTAFGNYNGGEAVTAAFFTAHPTIVDWVLVELRSQGDFRNVLARRAAFVTSNGTLMDIDGTTGVGFPTVTSGSYYISISHRNHLIVLTPTAQAVSPTSSQYDFSSDITKAMNNSNGNAMVKVGAVWAMWAGDTNHDNSIDQVDRGRVKMDVNAAYFDDYRIGDIFMDGNSDTVDYLLISLNAGLGIVSPLF